ncbi:MAG TPA: hypothetical protein VGR28_00960 [Candidatus Thermoplasmatota archaeon]|jgi:hypothetical protein|nr:hypothetical protein [Candidatus Thermoplasmatota archaeon]
MPKALLVVLGLLTVNAGALALSVPLPLTQVAPESEQPTQEEVTIQLNLTGVATQTNGGPDDGFTAYINVTGTGTKYTPQGNGVQIRADDLEASVVVVRTSDNVEVENFTALVGFHAQEASSIAQGLPAGSFDCQFQLRGQRSEVIVGNADDDERVLSIQAHGGTVGEPDGGVFAMSASGTATTQPDGTGSGARHFNIDLSGEGSTGSIQ